MAEELRKWHGILEAKVGRFVGIETGIGITAGNTAVNKGIAT